jgi:cell wall-associated NlpC family hydrolase
MTTRAEFVALVRSYVGTPFVHQGRLPGVGLDCPGPLICACRHFGLVPAAFDITGYPRIPDGTSLQRHCEQHLQPIQQADMQPGDAILVAWQGGPPQHLGVLGDYPGGRLSMIHALQTGRGLVTETRVVFGRVMRFVAAYAVPGLS